MGRLKKKRVVTGMGQARWRCLGSASQPCQGCASNIHCMIVLCSSLSVMQAQHTCSSCCRRSASGSCSRLWPSRNSRSKAKMQTGTARAEPGRVGVQLSARKLHWVRAARLCTPLHAWQPNSQRPAEKWAHTPLMVLSCTPNMTRIPTLPFKAERHMQVSAGPPTADGAQLYAGAAAGGQLLPVRASKREEAISARLAMLAHSAVSTEQARHSSSAKV